VSFFSSVFQRIKVFLAVRVIRLLCLTWRVRLLGPEPNDLPGPFVFCFWHGNQAGLLAHPRVRPATVMTSLSRDGALQAEILKRLGFTAVRGSSSKGGAAGLKAVISEIKKGSDAMFAVDGPRGPLHKIKPGALYAAEAAGVPVISLCAVADRAWVFHRAWDRYTLPKPFAKVDIIRGAPLSLNGDIDSIKENLARSMTPPFF
jgi:lysophospholipid acyltransferase (LPLAT)-like uncharacterized protein